MGPRNIFWKLEIFPKRHWGPQDTAVHWGSPMRSISKFIESENFENLSGWVWFNNDKNSHYRLVDQMFVLKGAAEWGHCHTLPPTQYWARRSRAMYNQFQRHTSVFHHLPSVSPKQLYVLAHLGCTRIEGSSWYFTNTTPLEQIFPSPWLLFYVHVVSRKEISWYNLTVASLGWVNGSNCTHWFWQLPFGFHIENMSVYPWIEIPPRSLSSLASMLNS